jgi:UTP--glucose-1-phosphate uridylyltransferase
MAADPSLQRLRHPGLPSRHASQPVIDAQRRLIRPNRRHATAQYPGTLPRVFVAACRIMSSSLSRLALYAGEPPVAPLYQPDVGTSTMLKVTKAVFPVAGLGTRFLPATKASPKEMLPVVDKPLIQYAVEEAIAAGITEMIFVTGRSKRAIEDHFDKSYEIEAELEARGKAKLLDLVRNIKPANVDCFYVRQAEALGLGHAVLCAEKLVGDSPFAVILADDLLHSTQPVMKQLVNVFNHYHSSVVGVETIAPDESRSYGVIDGREWEKDVIKLKGIVEKPEPEKAPSNLGVVGRYVLMPTIFQHIRALKPGAGGELQLTDALESLLSEEQVLAYRYFGKRFDCGSKLGYLKATVEFALRHPEVKVEFEEYLQSYLALQPTAAAA